MTFFGRFVYSRAAMLLLLLGSAFQAEFGFACASCGSGSGSPLILFPNERHKVYLGVSTAGQFQTIDTRSQRGSDGGAARKDTLTVAIGTRLADQTFFTLTIPYVTNRRGGRGYSSVSDPLFQLRHTVIEASIVDLWLPQIQVVWGYRHPVGLSIRDHPNDFDPLRVTSAGTSEAEFGFDLWSGPGWLKWGTAHSVLLPQERRFAGNLSYEPGLGFLSVLTFGVAQDGLGKAIMGVTRLSRERIRVDGETIDKSETLTHSFFFTTEYWFAALQSLRLTYSRSGFLTEELGNQNTFEAHNVSLAWMMATPNR